MRPRFVPAALAAALCSPLCAQLDASEPARRLLDALVVPLHREALPDGHALGIWAAGPDWKASFHDGLCVLPRPTHPDRAAKPWRWRTQSVRAGARELPLAWNPEPEFGDGMRAEYPLGPIVERYELRSEGIEQSFLLIERIDGDWTIQGRVDSELRAAPRAPRHAPLEFVDPDGGGGLRYGAALAIDALGRTLPLASAWDGAQITLTVPGEWLAEAAWPVLVDPLLGAILVDHHASAPVERVVVARDDVQTSRNLGFALERRFAAGDSDLYFVLANDTLQGAALAYSHVGTANAQRPALGFVAAANRWVLAWDSFDYGNLAARSVYLLHDGGATTPSNALHWVPGAAGRPQHHVALGGNAWSVTQDPLALFAWTAEPAGSNGNTGSSEVWAARLDVATNTAGTPFRLAGGGTLFALDTESPAVSVDRGLGSWLVVWQQLDAVTNGRWRVQGRRVGASGSPSSGILLTDRNALDEHQLAPKVDGRSGRWLVSFQTRAPGVALPTDGLGTQIRAQRFDWNEAVPFPVEVGPSMSVASGTFPLGSGLRVDAIAHDPTIGSHWALCFATHTVIGSWTTLAVLGHDARTRDSLLLGTGHSRSAGVAYDDDNGRFALGYGYESNGQEQLLADRFAYPSRSAPQPYGSGCGAATISAVGSFLAGDEDQVIRLSGAPPTKFAYLLISFGSANLPLDPYGIPGCTLLVDPTPGIWFDLFWTVTNAQGIADIELPLPSTLPDLDVCFQWLYRTSTGHDYAASSALRVAIR